MPRGQLVIIVDNKTYCPKIYMKSLKLQRNRDFSNAIWSLPKRLARVGDRVNLDRTNTKQQQTFCHHLFAFHLPHHHPTLNSMLWRTSSQVFISRAFCHPQKLTPLSPLPFISWESVKIVCELWEWRKREAFFSSWFWRKCDIDAYDSCWKQLKESVFLSQLNIGKFPRLSSNANKRNRPAAEFMEDSKSIIGS